MKCEDCLNRIEEYFDAELDAKQSREIEAHLTACRTCAAAHQALGREQEIYTHYSRDVEVTPALWQAIQSGIRQETVQPAAGREVVAAREGFAVRLRRFFAETFAAPRFSPALAALLVVVAIGATVAVMKLTDTRSATEQVAGEKNPQGNNANQNGGAATSPQIANAGNTNQAVTSDKQDKASQDAPLPEEENKFAQKAVKDTVAARPKAPVERQQLAESGDATAEKLLKDAERKYLAAISILQRNFNKRRPQLDSALVARLDAALGSIDNTIAETKKAMRENPNDPIALQYMLSAYAKKVEVLRDVTTD